MPSTLVLTDEVGEAVGLGSSSEWWRVFRWENTMPGHTIRSGEQAALRLMDYVQ